MSKINYFQILKNAWVITWHNKYLWWFGFLLSLSGSGGFFNYHFGDFNQIENGGISPETKKQVVDFFASYADWIIVGSVALAIALLFFLILGTIARGGLIKSIEKISKGEAIDFKTGFGEGKEYFWKLLFINLAIGIFLLALIATLSIPIIFLFYGKAYILGSLLAIGALIILIPVLILAHFSKIYGYIYAIMGNVSFGSAIENGYLLFRKNLSASIIMSLLLMVAGIIFGITAILILIPFIVLFLIIGAVLYLIMQKIGVAIAAIFGGIALIAIMLFLQSIFQTFLQTSWVLFFKEIASPKIPETVAETVPEKISSPSAAPDPVTFIEE